ncbi:MAG: hypothetical protein SX243_01300 [Acidobacteriota bacterium]|jgi:hypothetical protein|nr:hypothetical protein [Acidobacteriota bacterium]
MNDIDTADLITFANRWAKLGDAIASQVTQLVEDPHCGNCWQEGNEHGVNPVAIEKAYERLQGLNDELDELLEAFLESVDEEA